MQRKIGEYVSPDGRREVEDAYNYSKSAHSGQRRASGKPYIQHPLAVADILADWRFDAKSIAAALLHDVVEDTPISLEQVREKFGGAVALLVGGLSKIGRIEGIDRREQEAEAFRKILLAAAGDWRVLFIKLADRLHNMRTLSAIPEPSRRRRIALETLTIYAPIAERLGFSPVKDELQNLSFRYLRPHRYRVLSKAVNRSKANSRHVIARIEEMIRAALDKHEIKGELEKRRKNLHSVYRKMETQRLSFARVEDIIGFRLIVGGRMECYRALGALHEACPPVRERFKDYIAIPKSNGYQSLHTALITKEGVRAEIQIRTRGMHETAEYGLAAHWTYKQGAAPGAAQREALNRLSSLVRLHAENDAPGDFMEYLRVELSPGEMYVLTPQGEAVRLPPDSTALDFAYFIHTDVGDRAESAVVNGAPMPLSRRLQSGDQVSIKTNPDSRPMPHWLGVAKTARARSRIRQILNAASRGDSIALGKKLLAAALKKIDRAPPLEDIQEDHWRAFLRAKNMEDPDGMFLELGLGKMLPDIAARELLRRQVRRGDRNARLQPMPIAGAAGAAITLSPCCYPLPFESIVGVLQKNRGLVVHADKCPAVRSLNRRSEKWVDAAWSEKAENALHRSAVVLECRNKTGLAAEISTAIGGQNINIITFNFSGGELARDSIQIETVVEVNSLPELNRLLRVLREIPDVVDARRREASKTA